MSSTGRSDVRRERDDFPTPGWCVDRLLDRNRFPGGIWLEPSAGEGGIIRSVNAWRSRAALTPVSWAASEINPAYEATLGGMAVVEIGDFLRPANPSGVVGYDVAIGNPPYEVAMDFVLEARRRARVVAFLLRANFLGSAERQDFWQRDMPDIYLLPNRPTFAVTKKLDPRSGKWKTTSSDSCEYAWFVWPEPHFSITYPTTRRTVAACFGPQPSGIIGPKMPNEATTRRTGRIEVLDITPEDVRAQWRSRAPVVTVGANGAVT